MSHKQIVNRNQKQIVSISETSLLYSRVRNDRNQLSNSNNAGSGTANSNANNGANLGGPSNDNATGSGRGGSSSNPGMCWTPETVQNFL